MNADARAGFVIDDEERAGIGIRVLAYAIDSALLFGFTMVFATAAFLVIFLGSDTGRSNVTDGQEWGLTAVLMATIPAWYLFNVLLIARRGQTVGQYVAGLQITDETGKSVPAKRLSLYWLALHPLLFHPILALPWLLFAYIGLALAEIEVLFVLALAMGLLCLLAPLAGFIFLAADPQRRAIHDRLAGLRVVRL